MTMTNEQEWWSVAETATLFGVATATVRHWIENGHLPGARKRGPATNSPWIIPEAAVEEMARQLEATRMASAILVARDIAASVPRVYLHTTLALLREHVACDRAYRAVQRALPGGWGDDDPIPLARAVDVPGLALPGDWLWALRAVPPEQAVERDRYARLLAASIAEAVLPIWERDYPGDERPRQAINAARRYADGEATDEELAAALAAAAAARAVAAAAATTATAAARNAARAADAAAARAVDAAVAVAAATNAARAVDAATITEVLRLTILREPVEEGGSCPPSHHVDD